MHKMLRRTLGSTLGAAALLAISSTMAHAQTVSLASLLVPGATITSGDKLFSNFSYIRLPSATDMPTADNIAVTPQNIAGNFGLDFSGAFHANPPVAPATTNAQSVVISYRVTVTDPLLYISDVHLDGDPTVTGGNGQAQVVESASDIITHTSVLPNTLHIFDTVTGGTNHSTTLNDSANTLGLFKALDIEKTISASSDSPTTNASISHIQQTFSQAPAPEPSSLALLGGLGLIAVPGVRRLRRARKG